MRLSWSAAVGAAFYLTTSLVSAKSTLSILHTPRADTSLSISDHQTLRRSLSDFPKDGATPSTAVMNATDTACVDRLLELSGVAGSLTGMSVCYAVSSLNSATGEFISQISLYQVSAATGNWTTIDPTSLNVNIAYPGANLTQSALMKRAGIAKSTSRTRTISRSRSKLQARTSNPVLVMSEVFRGTVMTGWDPNNQTTQMLALQPIVTLSALTPSTPQQGLTATLPATEAAFVAGAFVTQAQTQAATLAAARLAQPFIIPGTRPNTQISPVGPILTAAWALLFIATLAAGTLQRARFRKAYRRKARFVAWQGGFAPTTPSTAGISGYGFGTAAAGSGVRRAMPAYEAW